MYTPLSFILSHLFMCSYFSPNTLQGNNFWQCKPLPQWLTTRTVVVGTAWILPGTIQVFKTACGQWLELASFIESTPDPVTVYPIIGRCMNSGTKNITQWIRGNYLNSIYSQWITYFRKHAPHPTTGKVYLPVITIIVTASKEPHVFCGIVAC